MARLVSFVQWFLNHLNKACQTP